MSVVKNGWNDNVYHHVNLVNGNWFGLIVNKWYDVVNYTGLRINDKQFGWIESYNDDGFINTDLTGFYLNDRRI